MATGPVLPTIVILLLGLRTLLVLLRLSLMLALMRALSLMLPLSLMRLVRRRTRGLLCSVMRVLRSVMNMLRGTLRRKSGADSQREHTPSELES